MPKLSAGSGGVSPSFIGDPKGRGKTLLQTLCTLQATYPEYAAALDLSIEELRRDTKRVTRSARDRIELLLERAVGLTFDELRDDLQLSESSLRRMLAELMELGLVERVTTGRRIDPRRGRAEYLYKLTHTSPTGDAYAAPRAERHSMTRAAMDALAADD